MEDAEIAEELLEMPTVMPPDGAGFESLIVRLSEHPPTTNGEPQVADLSLAGATLINRLRVTVSHEKPDSDAESDTG